MQDIPSNYCHLMAQIFQGSCLMWETEEKPASSSCAFSSCSSSSARSSRSGTVGAVVPSKVLPVPLLSLRVWRLL